MNNNIKNKFFSKTTDKNISMTSETTENDMFNKTRNKNHILIKFASLFMFLLAPCELNFLTIVQNCSKNADGHKCVCMRVYLCVRLCV